MKFLQNSLMWTEASSGKSYSSKETRGTWFSSIFCQFCVYFWSRINKDFCWDVNKQSYCEDNLEKICSAWHCELHQHKLSFTLRTCHNPFSHCTFYRNYISSFVALGTILQSLIFWFNHWLLLQYIKLRYHYSTYMVLFLHILTLL